MLGAQGPGILGFLLSRFFHWYGFIFFPFSTRCRRFGQGSEEAISARPETPKRDWGHGVRVCEGPGGVGEERECSGRRKEGKRCAFARHMMDWEGTRAESSPQGEDMMEDGA